MGTVYVKPNMTNIPGELGKRIMDTIRQSPKQDKIGREARARRMEQEIMAAESRRDGGSLRIMRYEHI